MSIKKKVKASYDLFGIDHEEFFTKDDLVEFTNEVESKLPQFGWISDAWIENNIVHVHYTTEDGYEYNSDVKIDFRKIRKPSDLLKYSNHIATDIENQIVQNYEYESDNSVTSAEELDDDISEVDQEFSSADTAVNGPQGKLPAVFKMITIPNGSLVLDYGGGKPEAGVVAQAYLDQFDATELIYDPFNQTKEHNQDVVKRCRENGGADIAVCSNVLNVIKEPEVRLNVLKNIKKLTKPNGSVYITVYEGSGSGEGSATQKNKSYQNNRKTSGYLEEVQQIFPDAIRKGKLISATNSTTSKQIAGSTYIGNGPSIDSVADEIHVVARRYLIQEFGFTEQDVDDYLKVDTKYYDEDNATCIQVRAELSYGALMELSEILDPIVQKYDEDSYFDTVSSGIIETWVYDYNIAAATNTCGIAVAPAIIESAIDEDGNVDTISESTEITLKDVEVKLVSDDKVDYYLEFTDTDYSWFDFDALSIDTDYGRYEIPNEDVLDYILDYVASEIDDPIPGTYNLSCDVTLVCDISGIYVDESNESHKDSAEVDIDYEKSKITNIHLDKVS